MRLDHYAVTRTLLPLSVPFHTALRSVTTVEEIRVTLTTDTGLQGIGSAAPTAAITGETEASIAAALQHHILPALSTIDLDDVPMAMSLIRRAIVGNFSAKAAADIALHDLYAKSRQESLTTYLGGRPRTLWTDATVSLSDASTMRNQALSLVGQGFRHLKLKLGGRDGHDVERVVSIRQELPDDVQIWLDPNQAWSVRESLAACEALGRLDIVFVEQPVAAHDVKGLQQVTMRSPIPIAADESVFGLDNLLALLDLRAADIINVKLMKCGGLAMARTMAEIIQSAGVKLMVGSMMEGMASVTAAAIFAGVFDAAYLDLDAAYFLSNPKAVGGLQYAGGAVTLPRNAGLGVGFVEEEGAADD